VQGGIKWNGEIQLFNNKIPELASFLNHGDRELDEVLSFLVTQTMIELEVSSIFMCSLTRHNRVELVGHVGVEETFLMALPSDLTIFDSYPFTDALRNKKTVWINTLPNWRGEYPNMDAIKFSGLEKTFFCVSIERDSTPIAAICFFALPAIDRTPEIDRFLDTVSNLISLNFYRHSKKLENKIHSRTHVISTAEILSLAKLTVRQTSILKMMSDDCTNFVISEILGFSESTIRQESIKIYAKLNCKGRGEASQLYKAQMVNN
jgi:DNA-binding NarL/FixJ family response regulator